MEKIARRFTLPPLPYDFHALEPHLSQRTLELHYGKHHAAYVDSANRCLDLLASLRSVDSAADLAAVQRTLAFNVSGHILHSVYFDCLGPPGLKSRPTGPLSAAIERDFGSFDAFRSLMNTAASTIMGSGWAVLVWESVTRRLLVAQIQDHQNNVMHHSHLIMVMDAWEHAFYLQYENRKAEHFDALWRVWNWRQIEKRFERALADSSSDP